MFEYFSKENRQKRKARRNPMSLKDTRSKTGFSVKLSAMVLGLSPQKYTYYEQHQEEFSQVLINDFCKRLLLYKNELDQRHKSENRPVRRATPPDIKRQERDTTRDFLNYMNYTKPFLDDLYNRNQDK